MFHGDFPCARDLHWHVRRPQGDVRPSPCNPWAGYLTEILFYVEPFKKFSWCFKSEDFRINKRRLARLPHESALTYVVGFSV